jgi:hypothetical protein
MREIDTIDNLDGTLTIKYLDDSLKRICVFYIYIYIYIYIYKRERGLGADRECVWWAKAQVKFLRGTQFELGPDMKWGLTEMGI